MSMTTFLLSLNENLLARCHSPLLDQFLFSPLDLYFSPQQFYFSPLVKWWTGEVVKVSWPHYWHAAIPPLSPWQEAICLPRNRDIGINYCTIFSWQSANWERVLIQSNTQSLMRSIVFFQFRYKRIIFVDENRPSTYI